MKSVFILMDSKKNIKTFASLRILCDSMKDTEGFPSYWVLSRKEDFNFENGFLDIKANNEVFEIVKSNVIHPPKQDKKGSKLLENKKKGQT